MAADDLLITLGAVSGALAAIGYLSRSVIRQTWRWGKRAINFVDDVTGEPARPGVDRRPGLVEQVVNLKDGQQGLVETTDMLRSRQEEIAGIAMQAADDVSAVRHELTRNGGTFTTKDVVDNAAKSAEAAAAAAELAHRSANRTEKLLRTHLENTEEILDVSAHNQSKVLGALSDHGIHVVDLREYPEIYTGAETQEEER